MTINLMQSAHDAPRCKAKSKRTGKPCKSPAVKGFRVGVVANSAICKHQGCPVNMWSKDRNGFVCSCHGSVLDPFNGAEVIAGPAPRSLPALALKVKDGVVVVAMTFSGRVGFTPP